MCRPPRRRKTAAGDDAAKGQVHLLGLTSDGEEDFWAENGPLPDLAAHTYHSRADRDAQSPKTYGFVPACTAQRYFCEAT